MNLFIKNAFTAEIPQLIYWEVKLQETLMPLELLAFLQKDQIS